MTESGIDHSQHVHLSEQPEGWPKTLILTATWAKRFESRQAVTERIRAIARDWGICLPDDEEYKKDLAAQKDDPDKWEYDEEHEKSEWQTHYPKVTWPPKTLKDLGEMIVEDLVDGHITPGDEFDDEPDFYGDVVEA